ncbi:MAG TPA: SCO family protein [Acidimicrobiales bacterium]|nr:SCO family protein [Acidimicrobiales bacterium]
MADIEEEAALSSQELTEEQRAQAFANTRPPVDLATAFRGGNVPKPPKFIVVMVAVFAGLVLTGAIVQRVVGSSGTNPTSSTTLPLPRSPLVPSGHQLSSSLSAILGLKTLNAKSPSDFTLEDQRGHQWTLSAQRGKVVILTFYNATCNDICPVLGAEIRQAQALLGSSAPKIVFAIVNTDPNALNVTRTPKALTIPHLGGLASVHFLTGSLNALNDVWTNYGISINVGAKPSEVAHNNLMYFINPSGALRAQALPFGNESHAGVFSLGAAQVHQFAEGVDQEASSLVR